MHCLMIPYFLHWYAGCRKCLIIAVDMEIRISLLQAVQAVFFSRCLLRFLPGIFGTGLFRTDSRQGIALLSFLNFAPRQLFGALGAVPYLIVALFCKREGGIGGVISRWQEQPAWYWDFLQA